MTGVYRPGSLETDQKKQNYALQQQAIQIDTNTTAISTITSAYVTSIAGNHGAFTLNATSGITNSTNDIVLSQASSSQFGAVKVDNSSITASSGVISAVTKNKLTNSLSSDVTVNNVSNYFDGPSVAQGTSGTWFASGTVTCVDTAGASNFYAKLWDGTTVIASGNQASSGANIRAAISLSGYITNPAGNIRISVNCPDNTSAKIEFNRTGTSKDSTISVFQIA